MVGRIDEYSACGNTCIERVPARQGPFAGPRIAVLFLQPRCNMHCTFCITEDNFDAMTFEQAAQLLRNLKRGGTVRSIVLGGGEPFDWPHDLIAIGHLGRSLGLLMQVGTNGIAMPDDVECLEAFDRYVLPLESVEPDAHNAMRLYRGRHHRIIMQRLEALRLAHRSVTVSTVVTQRNADHVPDVGRFLGRYAAAGGNVHAWHLYQFLPQGRGGGVNALDLALPESVYKDLCARAESLDLPFRIYRRSDMYRSRTVDFFWVERGAVRCGSEARRADPTPLTIGGR